MSPEQLREYAKKIVDQMPPLTADQRADLRGLLRPGVLAVQAAKTAALAEQGRAAA
jgi:hypothetical protein